MATYTFETITPAEAASYARSRDTLQFATPGTNAWHASLVFAPETEWPSRFVTVTLGGRSVDFGFGIHGSDARFPDGSMLFIGCPRADDWWLGTAAGDAMYGVDGDDSLSGLAGADRLQGAPGLDTLVGALGDDLLEGGDDNDILDGGADNDTLDGGAGADRLDGGAGANVLFGQDGDDYIIGGADFNRVNGNKGNDTVVGASNVGDWLLGGQGADSLQAQASTGQNIMNGNIGNDTVTGGAGNDTLRGGQGNDVIQGGAGDDLLFGDLGSNTLTGGAGADIYRNAAGPGLDLITDFNRSEGDSIRIDVGLTYSTVQSGSNVRVLVSNGFEFNLQNTQLSALTDGWIGS
ncbi:calcium-binding protein [Phenylobacterium sp. LjRoot225]|uniref:calcium-binding protein n=1 Tax=Phenylobacterium sp. LjRoot225 TaxID=3342285 RepID=UPI003ED0338A